ncbi:hypothetical protein, partial [uncultured Tenacibaculum sp.]|uniref:hypothetical protein n=1 Tax=uncultured Tenacibaculum sp. TaxID=174713 RepID=UPI00261F70FA
MNKYNEFSAINAEKNAKTLSEIGVYNQKVKEYLRLNKLDYITQHTIKLFKDNAQRKRINNTQYNLAVEQFNNTHGLLLQKKGSEFQTSTRYYSYINYPYLDRDSIKSTMKNYRLYVNTYNKKADQENEEIREYNHTKVAQHLSLSKTQKKRKKEFEEAHCNLFVRDYNKLVEKANTKECLIPKKVIQKVKYPSELIFNILVGFYTSQLRTRNAYLMEMNRPTSVKKNCLPQLKID